MGAAALRELLREDEMAGSYTRQQISDATGFDQGELFETDEQVREYMTVKNLRAMFGTAGVRQRELDRMAAAVIAQRWHYEDEKSPAQRSARSRTASPHHHNQGEAMSWNPRLADRAIFAMDAALRDAYAAGRRDGLQVAERIAAWLTAAGPADKVLPEVRKWTENLMQREREQWAEEQRDDRRP